MESRISKERRRKIFELTLALYRVTDFFPPGEALRKHLREKANDIFGRVSEYGYSEDPQQEAVVILGRIESVKGYLGIARSLRFIRPINLTVLEREYEALTDFFSRELEEPKTPLEKEEVPAKTTQPEVKKELPTWDEFASKRGDSNAINDRQKKILDHIKQVNQAKISDFFTVFGDISSKTIQRDLQDLVARSVLKKEGEKRWTIYSLNVQ